MNKPFGRPRMMWRFIPLFLLFIIAAGFITMSLWNWLIPALFHGPVITYLQAMGILLLSKILFGGFHRPWGRPGMGGGRHGGPMMWRTKMQEYMSMMTPEEKTAFKEKMAKRCGPRYMDWFDDEPKEAPKEAPQA